MDTLFHPPSPLAAPESTPRPAPPRRADTPPRTGQRRTTRSGTSHLLALACGLALHGAPAQAHDTWFLALPPAAGSTDTRLALGTGDPFPVHTTPLWPDGLAVQGCGFAEAGRTTPLRRFDLPRPAAAQGWRAPSQARHCWAQSVAFELQLPAQKVAAYLDEARASPELRARWAAQQAAGQTWQERYSKHARILLPAPGTPPDASSHGGASAVLGLDIRLHNAEPLQRQQPLQAQVLRDGQPWPGLAVELRHDRSRFSQWAVSDAQGRLSLTPPLPGTWVLRAIDLQPPEPGQTHWQSRFVSLVFDVPR